jgi:hypothetical protein
MTPPNRRQSADTDPPASAGSTIDGYLDRLAAALPGPARARAAILAELRAGLLDATEARRQTGLKPFAAAQAATREFGDATKLAAVFRPELATAKARRLAFTLLASAPLIALAWAAAAIGSHLGARHALPWQWSGASPAWQIALPLAAAAFVVGVCTAAATVATTGRLTRWLPDCARLAPTSAITAGLAAGAVDLILLLLLTHQLTRAPTTLDTTPVTIAAVASCTRLVFARRTILRPRSA